VLPLRRRGRVLESPTNFHTPQFALLADRGDVRRALAEAAFACRPRRVSIGFLDGERPDASELLRAANAAGAHAVVRTTMRSPYVPVETDWAMFERGLSRQLLADLRRCRRRLEELGEVSVDFIDDRANPADLLKEVFAVDARSWKAETGSAIVSHENTQRFYEQVSDWAAGRGSLRVALLRVDGRPVAMELGIEEAKVHFAMKSSYDSSYHRFSPGKLLLQAVIERAFTTGLESVELLGAEDGYKRLWATHSRERMALRAYAGSAMGWLQWTAEAYGRPLARRAGLDRARRKLRRVPREATLPPRR
jgi:CelD/BcsL family acetyltransferase involved in cellulose biosynthesis